MRVADEKECTEKEWGQKPDQAVVVYSPPHPQTRFRAFKTLDEGVDAHVAHQDRLAKAQPDLLATLNAGGAAGVAHILINADYYTGSESDYAASMTAWKAEIDHSLGPLP